MSPSTTSLKDVLKKCKTTLVENNGVLYVRLDPDARKHLKIKSKDEELTIQLEINSDGKFFISLFKE